MPPKLLESTSPAVGSADTCCAQILPASPWGSCQTLLQKKGPQVSAGHTMSSVGCVLPQAQPLQVPWDSHSSMGEMSGLAWWGCHGVHKQKPKLPASEMLQDITASISIIISR